MPQVTVNYRNLNKHPFSAIRKKITDHLTPKREDTYIVSQIELPSVRNELQRTDSYILQFSLDRYHVNHIAKDIGLFPETELDTLRDRYRVTFAFGGLTTNTVLIYGKDVFGMGDFPLSFRVESDDAGVPVRDALSLLKSWRNKLVELNGDKKKFAEAVMEVYRGAQGASPEHEHMMQRFPNTLEGFDKQIAEAQEQVWAINFEGTVNLLRFHYDFLGKPLTELGIYPDHIRVIGSNEFDLLLEGKFGNPNTDEGKKLVAHPETPLPDLYKLIAI